MIRAGEKAVLVGVVLTSMSRLLILETVTWNFPLYDEAQLPASARGARASTIADPSRARRMEGCIVAVEEVVSCES